MSHGQKNIKLHIMLYAAWIKRQVSALNIRNIAASKDSIFFLIAWLILLATVSPHYKARGGYQTCNAIGVRACGIKMGLSCVRMRPCN